MNNNKFHTIVIGAGPSGHRTGELIASKGFKVLVVDSQNAGGNCVNNACMPTKDLLSFAKEIEIIKKYGVSINDPWTIAKKRINETITKIKKGTEALMQSFNCEFKIGQVEILNNNELTITGEKYTFENLVIATGCEPVTLVIPKEDENSKSNPKIFNSISIQAIDKLPNSLLVLGAGPVGIEYAHIFQALGSKVTIAEASPIFLPILDADVKEVITNNLKNKNIDLFVNTKINNITKNGEVELITGNNAIKGNYDAILMAAGRKPVLPKGFMKLGIEINERGFIKVNEKLNTNVPNIYAVGDVAGQIQQTHVAYKCAAICADAITNKFHLEETIIATNVPSAIYINPEVAWVGTPEYKLDSSKKYIVAKKDMAKVGRYITDHKDYAGLASIWTDTNGVILGAKIVAENAGELIAPIAIMMEANLNINALAKTMVSHPTLMQVWHDLAINIRNQIKK